MNRLFILPQGRHPQLCMPISSWWLLGSTDEEEIGALSGEGPEDQAEKPVGSHLDPRLKVPTPGLQHKHK